MEATSGQECCAAAREATPVAAQRRQRGRGPLRAMPPEVCETESLEDSIPEWQLRGSCAADLAADFSSRRAARRR
jgi:hypothetical protein